MPATQQSIQECIDLCERCHRVCLETFTRHCLEAGGEHTEPDHARLMLDCIQICHTSADFMIRGSHLHHLTCAACAEVCRRCANSCEEIGEMDECVQICRQCAESCAAMSRP
jgi:hypothetical protein